MSEKNQTDASDNVAHIEDVLKLHNLNWRTVAAHAKQRERASKIKRTRLLRTLKTAGQTMVAVKDDLTAKEVAELQNSVVEIAQVMESLKNEPEEAMPPTATPGSPGVTEPARRVTGPSLPSRPSAIARS